MDLVETTLPPISNRLLDLCGFLLLLVFAPLELRRCCWVAGVSNRLLLVALDFLLGVGDGGRILPRLVFYWSLIRVSYLIEELVV